MKRPFYMVITAMLLLVLPTDHGLTADKEPIARISVKYAREMVQAGNAILVCSYEDNKCKSILLEGALLKSELEFKSATLPKEKPVIFYCA